MKFNVYIGTSLDGFIAGKNGEIKWLENFANDEAIDAYEEFMQPVDAVVMGRGSFEKVLSFPAWPYTKKVFVLSSVLQSVPEHLRDQVTLLNLPPAELAARLADLGFQHIYVDGGKVIQSFLREDMIDILIISTAPVLLGNGIPLFGQLDSRLQFRHLQTRIQSNGLVRNYYERIRDR